MKIRGSLVFRLIDLAFDLAIRITDKLDARKKERKLKASELLRLDRATAKTVVVPRRPPQ